MEAMFVGELDKALSVLCARFSHHAHAMVSNGVFAQRKLKRNLAVGVLLTDQPDDHFFFFRQFNLRVRVGAWGGKGLRRLKSFLHVRICIAFSSHSREQCFFELRELRIFWQKCMDTGFQSLANRGFVIVH